MVVEVQEMTSSYGCRFCKEILNWTIDMFKVQDQEGKFHVCHWLAWVLKVAKKFAVVPSITVFWSCSYPGRGAARRRGWQSARAGPPAARVPVPASSCLHIFISSYLHITVTSYHHIMVVWSNDKLLHGSTAPPSHQRCLECMQVQYSSDEYFSRVYDQIFISRDLSWRFPIDWSFSAIIIKINDIITRRVDANNVTDM